MSRALLLSLLVVTLMSACGGGSGGGGVSTGSVVAPTSATGTGLVPQAPSPGATLYANAADLRPMINGARWQYRAVQTRDGATSVHYVSSVDQNLVNGSLQETENAVFFDSNDVSTVRIAGGNVVGQAKDPLGVGSDEVLTVIELRSPVRVDDQITQFDRIDVPTGTDIDGDGKADVADFAIYSRVIGTEGVDLPELARTVLAVKVETTAAVRIKKSSDGSALPVRTVVQTQWYAAGIGVVRRSLGAPTPASTGVAIAYDERLSSWDGVTQGLGALGPLAVRLPSTSYPVTLPLPIAATTVGDYALVLAESLQPTDPHALTFAVLDKRGNLQSSRQVPHLGDGRSGFASPRLYGLDASTALLVMPLDSSPGTLKLQRVDGSGSPVGNPGTISLATNRNSSPTAWDGQALWAAWIASSGTQVEPDQLMLQPFGPDGQPLAAAQVIDTGASLGDQIGDFGLSAAGGRLLVSWTHSNFMSISHRYALMRGHLGTAEVHTLGTVRPDAVGSRSAIVPVIGSGVAALSWTGPQFGGANAVPDAAQRGVVLDAGGNVLRSSPGSLDDELLPAAWTGSGGTALVGALADRLVVGSPDNPNVVASSGSSNDFLRLSFVQPGSSPLGTAAASSSATSLAAVSSNSQASAGALGSPRFLLLWDDQALLICNDAVQTMVAAVWLR